MIICKNCGISAPDGSAYCPNCGGTAFESAPSAPETAPVSDNPSTASADQASPHGKKQKMPRKKVFIIATVVLVVLVALLVAAYTLFFPSDEVKFLRLQTAFLSTPLGFNNEITVDDFLRCDYTLPEIPSKIDLSMNMEIEDAGELSLLNDIGISLKADLSQEIKLLVLGLSYSNADIINAYMSASDSGLGFYIPQLDDNLYSIDTALLLQLIEPAIDDGTDMQTIDWTEQLLDGDIELVEFEKIDKPQSEYEKILSRYGKIILNSMEDGDLAVEKKASVQLDLCGSRTVDGCTIYRYTPSEASLVNMLTKLSERLSNDDDFVRYLVSVINVNCGEILKTFIGEDEKAFYDALYSRLLHEIHIMADDITENAEEYAKTVADSKFTWETIAKKKAVISQSISCDGISYFVWQNYVDDGITDSAIQFISDSGEGTRITSSIASEGTSYSGETVVCMIEDSSVLYDVFNIKFTDCSTDKKISYGIGYGTYEIAIAGSSLEGHPSLEPDDGALFINMTVNASEDSGSDHVISITSYEQTINLRIHSTDQPPVFDDMPDEAVPIESVEEFETIISGMMNSLMSVIYRLALGFGM